MTEFGRPELLRARVASVKPNSVGRNLQVKGRRIASFRCPLLTGLRFQRKTKREGSPPSKASSTLCHRNGFTKSLESFARGVRFDRRPSFLDLPAKGNPLPKVRVLGSRRKSVAEKK